MNKRAFTLVELAVVLLVIGILAGLLLRNLGGFTSIARDQRRIGDLKNVSIYLSNYYTRQGRYPTVTSWSTLEQTLRDAGVLAPGMTLPKDPVGNKDYDYYYCSSTGGRISNYILRAQLENSTSQAPQLYEGSITTTPSGLSCTPTPQCNPNNNSVCFLF